MEKPSSPVKTHAHSCSAPTNSANGNQNADERLRCPREVASTRTDNSSESTVVLMMVSRALYEYVSMRSSRSPSAEHIEQLFGRATLIPSIRCQEEVPRLTLFGVVHTTTLVCHVEKFQVRYTRRAFGIGRGAPPRPRKPTNSIFLAPPGVYSRLRPLFRPH